MLKVSRIISTPETCRVATAQGKRGIWFLLFPDRGKHREFCSDTGKNLLTQGNYFDCDY